MALYEGKYGVITQLDESTYQIGNYEVVASGESWVLSPIDMPSAKTWLTGSATFTTVEDAIRVAIVFSKEDGIANGLREMLVLFSTLRTEGK
jgi:hypothetical protein